VNTKKLMTYAFMAKYYFGHHFGRLLPSGRHPSGGLDKFLDNYRADRILPLTPEERAVLPDFQGCVSCGLCTSACVLTAAPGKLLETAPIDPRAVAVSYARSIPDFWSLRGVVERCRECSLCEEICPTDTPLLRMVRFMDEKSREAVPA